MQKEERRIVASSSSTRACLALIASDLHGIRQLHHCSRRCLRIRRRHRPPPTTLHRDFRRSSLFSFNRTLSYGCVFVHFRLLSNFHSLRIEKKNCFLFLPKKLLSSCYSRLFFCSRKKQKTLSSHVSIVRTKKSMTTISSLKHMSFFD